jgi:hypothetical protein
MVLVTFRVRIRGDVDQDAFGQVSARMMELVARWARACRSRSGQGAVESRPSEQLPAGVRRTARRHQRISNEIASTPVVW